MSDVPPPAEKHALTLKVMRLSRPTLATLPSQHTLAPADILGATSATTQALTLPASFGSLFLGETFESYVCIVNESRAVVNNAGIKAELQTQTQRFTLADTTSNANGVINSTSLAPAKSAEFLLSHEIKELGPHILVCSIHYTGANKEPKSFRKFFKFHVLNPLSVKTKVNSLADGSRVFLEAQVQNTSGIPMFLEKLIFESSQLFNSQDVSQLFIPDSNNTEKSHVSVFANTPVLNDKDSRQYLYILTPKTENDPLSKSTPTLGKLDIQWRTTMGQQGRLQTSQLTRKITPTDPIRVEIVRLSDSIAAEKPFRATCRLWNHSLENEMDASVVFVKSKMSSVLLLGPSERKVGPVPVGGSVEFEVDFFPLLSGVQKVSGMRILDSRSSNGFEIDVLCEVCVA
ncbi:hypothetical protein BDR26DRAFT_861696 [Obelidium mucronatum]|nr:hypothetical protein BDR26DRAFT_861696 [Obelidium mucronatum]